MAMSRSSQRLYPMMLVTTALPRGARIKWMFTTVTASKQS
jgi:hypothetical protein